MKKVLHYVAQMDIGGIESLIMNLYRQMDRNNTQFDFAVHTEKKAFFDDEITAMGGKFYRFDTFSGNPLRYEREWNSFWDSHAGEYDVFHYHTPSFGNTVALKCAMKHGVPVVIAHCHNTYASRGRFQVIHDLLHSYYSRHITRYATHFFACSEDAAAWGFSRNFTEGRIPVTVMKNGIDLENFRFHSKSRQILRESLNISDRFVIGNVGRLCTQKNQSFLIDILAEVLKKRDDAVLMLVGEGNDRKMLEDMAVRRNVRENVLMLGARTDIPQLMSAMDVFAFPSLHEGFGISAVEAQAVGLATYLSESRVPHAVEITPYAHFLPRDAGLQVWADSLCEECAEKFRNTGELIKAAGYDIKDTARAYEEFVQSGGQPKIYH